MFILTRALTTNAKEQLVPRESNRILELSCVHRLIFLSDVQDNYTYGLRE